MVVCVWMCMIWQMEELAAAQRAANGEEGELEALRNRVEGMAAEQKRTMEGHVAELTRE